MIPRGEITFVALLAAALALLLVPGATLAQERTDDILIRINGAVNLAAGDSVDILLAVDSPAQVAGTVRDALVIVEETATIAGDVGGDVIVFNGTLNLESTARIGGDVVLINGELNRADGATVGGSVVERDGASIGAEFSRVTAAVSVAAWLGMTLLFVIVALTWAVIGGRQLSAVAGRLGATPWLAAGAAAIAWIVLPLVAFLAFVTVIGIPLSITLLVVVAPLLWGLGYVAVATRLGFVLADLRGALPNLAYPYQEAVIGVVVLQLIGLVPVIGGIVVTLAGLFGAGAIIVHLWRRVGAARNQADVPLPDAPS